jgi:FtsP/CotA-like multicopper oxidase with cupredoxin domain
VVSAVSSYCPVILSVEGHLLTVVASDGQEVEPEEVASLSLSDGERFDFLISTQGHEPRFVIQV